VALEPQPQPGALADTAAGPAGRAVETPYAAAAALSDAPGIEANRHGRSVRRAACLAWPWRASRSPVPSQTTPPHGAMQRGRRWRGKSGGPPPLSRPDTSAATPRFSAQTPRRIRRWRVEPFSLPPDITLPGTLHHSGIRPAPPSDHTPLARRSAFQRQCERSRRREFGRARGVETPVASAFLPWRGRGGGISQPMKPRNLAVPLPLLQREAGDSHES
jgi:hypothetical protein